VWTDLDSDRRVGETSQAKPERLYVFVILVTHPKSYIESRRRIAVISAANRQSRDEDGCYREKIPEFCSVGGDRSKNSIFRVFGYPSTILCTAYRKQVYFKPMESRDSEGVPFASLVSL